MELFEDASVPVVTEFVVQSADDMHLGTAVIVGFLASGDDLLVAHRVTLGVSQIGAERAETAAIDANVRWVQVGIDVVVTDIAVDLLAFPVGQFAHCVQGNLGIVKKNPIIEAQTAPLLDLVADTLETVFNLYLVHGWISASAQ